jgi:hypothetical protein
MNNVLIWKLTLKNRVLNIHPPTPVYDSINNIPYRIPIDKIYPRKLKLPYYEPQYEQVEEYYEEQPVEQESMIESEPIKLSYCSSGLVPDLLLNTDTFLSPISINVNSQSSTYILDIFISSNGYSVTNLGEIYLTFATSQNNSMNIDNSYNLGYYINQLSETKINNSFITMANNSSTINYHLVNSGVNTNDFITSSRIIFTPEIIGELFISPVVTMTTNLPSTLYYNFNIVQLK